MKKFLAALLVCIMLISFVSQSFAANTPVANGGELDGAICNATYGNFVNNLWGRVLLFLYRFNEVVLENDHNRLLH